MSRWICVTFLFVCAICVTQAFPQAGPQTTPAPSGISEIWNQALQTIQNSFPSDIMNDPAFQKILQEAQNLMQNVATTAASFVPEKPNRH